MFGVEFLGHFPGFDFGPTLGLVEQYNLRLSHGFARTTSPRLWLPATTLLSESDLALHMVQERMDALTGVVGGASPITSFGVAEGQLDGPEDLIWSMFVANMQARNLGRGEVAQGELFINPQVSYVEEEGVQEDFDGCLSLPGLMFYVRRWMTIDISALGRPPSRETGSVAFIIQHEHDHDCYGMLCVHRRVPETPSFFVPPELRPLFVSQYIKTGRWMEWPYQLPGESWLDAMAFLDAFRGPYTQN